MKKTVCIILACVFAASLAACGGKGGDGADTTAAKVNETAPVVTTAAPETTEAIDLGNVEIDITELNSTMVYSQVYDFIVSPDDYIGKTVKMNGTFAVYESPERNYYACVIQDATACCSQGIEFVLDGDFTYPNDYPALGEDITVVGVFDSYYEGQNRYIQLVHAKMS